jgi:hypothetical protein
MRGAANSRARKCCSRRNHERRRNYRRSRGRRRRCNCWSRRLRCFMRRRCRAYGNCSFLCRNRCRPGWLSCRLPSANGRPALGAELRSVRKAAPALRAKRRARGACGSCGCRSRWWRGGSFRKDPYLRCWGCRLWRHLGGFDRSVQAVLQRFELSGKRSDPLCEFFVLPAPTAVGNGRKDERRRTENHPA